MKFRVNRGDQNRQWKLDRRQLKFRSETWNGKLTEIWQLISTTPEEFKGGGVWNVIVNINGALQAIGYAPPGAVFCDGRGQDLRQLYRAEEAGNGLQILLSVLFWPKPR